MKLKTTNLLTTGEPNQRLRLEFRDFDLFYGGAQ